MKVKIDKVGRMYYPKTLIDILKIELPTELEVYYNSNNHSIIISPDSMFSIKHEIKKRLNKDISTSEKNFLISLLDILEVENDKDKSGR